MSLISAIKPPRAASVYWRSLIGQIERQQKKLQDLSSTELRKQSLSLQYRAKSGEKLDSLLVEAYALVREAARRKVQMEHYRVQLYGGIAMHFGSVAVMQTGEGKTLTATLPLFLAALPGHGAHLSTANDYLAARDAASMSPIFEALGMNVGVVTAESNRSERYEAYRCDITYSTAKEIGFDFLRDRLHARHVGGGIGISTTSMSELTSAADESSETRQVQRDLNFMLVDEADSILIDEARTPLVVSAAPDAIALARQSLYEWCAQNVDNFSLDEHFELNVQKNSVELTLQGRKHLRKLPHPESIAEMPLLDIYDFMEQAILVARRFSRDRHYVIREDEVVIVDEFTGRLAEGRKWRAGLHQAIEAREELDVSVETGEAARITIQDLFLRYRKLAGMTGTVAASAAELRKIYRLRSVMVPTNRPPRRRKWPDLVVGTEIEKWHAIADEVEKLHAQGRPVLIGTRSIDKSICVSDLLKERSIPHQVLNASQVEREAEIVAAAGQVGKVTVATNMAGRGTDIKLDEESRKHGGLHVICTELHESARIDRQLIGRCGRQGDPGSYRQFVSLDDDILITGFSESFADRIRRFANRSSKQLSRLSQVFRRAQSRIERKHFRARKMLLYHERKRQEVQREMGQDPYLDSPG